MVIISLCHGKLCYPFTNHQNYAKEALLQCYVVYSRESSSGEIFAPIDDKIPFQMFQMVIGDHGAYSCLLDQPLILIQMCIIMLHPLAKGVDCINFIDENVLEPQQHYSDKKRTSFEKQSCINRANFLYVFVGLNNFFIWLPACLKL